MTTTTTGTPSPQVRNTILAVAALGLVAFIALNQGFSTNNVTGQQVAETAVPTLPESVTGFEYDHEVTSGRIATARVTGQYFGYNPEFDVPESDATASATAVRPSFFDKHPATGRVAAAALAKSVTGFEYDQESTPGHIVGTPVTGEYFGYSGELYPEGHALDQPMVEQPAKVTTVDPAVAKFEGIDLPDGYAVGSAQSAPAVVPVPSETAVRAVAEFEGIDLPDGLAFGSA
jgi:hypothetical protein